MLQFMQFVAKWIQLRLGGCVGPQQSDTGILEDEGLFWRRKNKWYSGPDRAELHGRKERNDDVDIVGEAGRDAIPAPDSGISHARCNARYDTQQLSIGQPSGSADDRNLVWISSYGTPQRVGYRQDSVRPWLDGTGTDQSARRVIK
jgi:hypothetical protein